VQQQQCILFPSSEAAAQHSKGIQVQPYSDRRQQQRQLLPRPQRNRRSCRVLLVTGIGHFRWTRRAQVRDKSPRQFTPGGRRLPRARWPQAHRTVDTADDGPAHSAAQPRGHDTRLPLPCPAGGGGVPRPPHHDLIRSEAGARGLRGPRAGRESVRADDSRFPRSPPPVTCARSAVGSAPCAAGCRHAPAIASAWSRLPTARRGAVQEHNSTQASRAQKLPLLRCFLGRAPRPIRSRGPLLFLHTVGSGLDGRDRADEAPAVVVGRWAQDPSGNTSVHVRASDPRSAAGSAATRSKWAAEPSRGGQPTRW